MLEELNFFCINIVYLQKIHDLRCSTRNIHDKFHNMSDEKKVIVQELRFGSLMHIPAMNGPHKLLKELAYLFDLYNNTLYTWYGEIHITHENIGAALGLSTSRPRYPSKVIFKELSEENKKVVRNFQGLTLSQLTSSMMEISVDGEENRLKFKRTSSSIFRCASCCRQ
ncbi:hypothetical protein AHAS_Ahas07G0091200 [Arachis hypogaea]